MENRARSAALACLSVAFSAAVQGADSSNQHSPEAVAEALRSPIPASALAEAVKFDDQILQQGVVDGTKVYLVTDERLRHAEAFVSRLLTSIGETPKGWVVRVLDTEPKTLNAFVAGGKYVYVFTGLLDFVKSDDELGLILGHELGHSFLKHKIRREDDSATTLGTIAVLIGAISHGKFGTTASVVGEQILNAYSREDEREADAFGVLASTKAGFSPVVGVDFFTRLERISDEAMAQAEAQLASDRNEVLAAKADCETLAQQWDAGELAQTKRNAAIINERCALYQDAAAELNAENEQMTASRLSAKLGDHPANQERIAAIMAVTDWLKGARTYESLQPYAPAQRVIYGLRVVKSPIVAATEPERAAQGDTAGTGNHPESQPPVKK